MEEKKWVSISNNPAWNYMKDIDNSEKVLGTGSAFLGAIGVNAIVQGFFSDDFNWRDLINVPTLLVAFASGLGVVFVQEDAINKASEYYYTKDADYIKYHKENLDLSYEVRDYNFQRKFIKELNEKEFQELIETLTTKQINSLKNDIYILESTKFLLKKKKHINKRETKLKLLIDELEEIEAHGIKLVNVKYIPYQVDDIFNFNQEEIQYGRTSIEDNSVQKHRRKNWLQRFYMPIISTLLTGGAVALLSQAILPVIISSIGFALLLIYVWFNTRRSHIKLKEKIATKREIKLNTHLNDAVKEFKSQKKLPMPKEKDTD